MTKEIYISSTPHETRLAVVEDDQLAEIYYERENEYTLAGSVYKGKVTRVLPGMQSAFVDVGLERDAFLYVTDFAEEQEDGDEYVPLTQNHSHGNGNRPAAAHVPPSNEGSSATPDDVAGSSPAAESGNVSDSGGRRWRGRRGRRRGRGGAQSNSQPGRNAAPETGTTDAHSSHSSRSSQGDSIPRAIEFELEAIPGASDFTPEDETEANGPSEIQISEGSSAEALPTPARHAPPQQAHAVVLPGESLSKYRRGQAPSEPAGQAATDTARSAHPTEQHASTFQPSTMVTAPLAWDGGDLLPGESISRYKNRPPQSQSPDIQQPASPSQDAPSSAFASPSTFASPAAEAGVVSPEATSLSSRPESGRRGDTEEVEGPAVSENFEPQEGSASYRFDPSQPSAYRQSGVAEPPEETAAVADSDRKISTQSDRTTSDHAAPVAGERSAVSSEPFFGESVSIAQPQTTLAQESLPDVEEIEQHDESSEEEEQIDDRGMHTFDPGHGNLEEEIIDEEEPEIAAAQASIEEDEFDDLIEETLDMQMDSELIGELVRDQHIEERTRFHGESVDGHGDDEGPVDEEEMSFSDGSTGTELVEIDEADEDEDDEKDAGAAETANADAASARPERSRGNRRGFRGQRPGQGGDRRRMRRSAAQTSNLPAITELLKPNQEILVQIAKEPIARKGARITSHIALPGRFLVFMPTVNHVGVSRKISSDEQRQRLKHILLSEKGAAPGGFIVRTAAASASEEDLRADIRFLLTLWSEIKQRADNSKPPALIYHDLSLVERVLRDQVTDNFSAIWVDSEADYERVLRFLNRFEPALVRRVKLYTKETPLFEQFGIQEEINKALRSKVWLKSGGSIVINQTEALVAIDINTGKYVGKTARLEDTILKTNLDAIPEIVRQIRLRDLGGIIVIDFIDMDERRNRNKVMQALEEELKSDRAPSKVLQFNDFGLVAITRKRVKQSLERTLSVPCYICTGTGMVKGPVTVCNEIYIELRKMHRQIDRADVLLRVHPEVVKQLKTANGRWLSEMEEMSGKTVIVKSDATLHPEQFDIH